MTDQNTNNPDTIPITMVTHEAMPDLPPETYTVNVPNDAASMRFIRAQNQFIRAMSFFMDEGRVQADDKEYIAHLTGYAKAQGEFIAAQQNFLAALGAV